VVVLECGLGGRLDATNVVTPSLSVITSIGLEHTRILGDTIEAIALEKAGIMKAGVPVLVGPNVPHDVLRAHAERIGSPYFVATDLVEYEGAAETTDFDDENSLIAMAAMRLVSDVDNRCSVTRHHEEQGIRCRPPCRFEAVDVLWDPSSRTVSQQSPGGGPQALKVVLDVGHNLPALAQLFAKVIACAAALLRRSSPYRSGLAHPTRDHDTARTNVPRAAFADCGWLLSRQRPGRLPRTHHSGQERPCASLGAGEPPPSGAGAGDPEFGHGAE